MTKLSIDLERESKASAGVGDMAGKVPEIERTRFAPKKKKKKRSLDDSGSS